MGGLALPGPFPIIRPMISSGEDDMRSGSADERSVRERRAWEAPAITEFPIARQTRAAGTSGMAPGGGRRTVPPPPAAPETKLGFSFEMSFPLSARTE